MIGVSAISAVPAIAAPDGGVSDTVDVSRPSFGLDVPSPSPLPDPAPIPAPAARFPETAPGSTGGNDGVVEFQLSTATFLHVIERQAMVQLHENPAVAAYVTGSFGGGFVYHDTVVTAATVAAPTAMSGPPAATELLIGADVDVVVSPVSAPATLVHLPGRVWLMLTPTAHSLDFRVVDGVLAVPGVPGAVPLVGPGGTGLAVTGSVPLPDLSTAIGAPVLNVAVAYDVVAGTGGTVAFRFATRPGDDLATWPGSRLTGEAGALVLPGGLFVDQATAALATQLHGADDGVRITDWSCCVASGWADGHAHTEGAVHGHGEDPVFGIGFSARIDFNLDVTGAPAVTGAGDFQLGVTAGIAWNTNAVGVIDGPINDAVKGAVHPPAGMHQVDASRHGLSFATDAPRTVTPPALVANGYFSGATATPDGYLATLEVHPPAPVWVDGAPGYPKCQSTLSEPKLTVADHSWSRSVLPRLLYPMVVTPASVAATTRAQAETATGNNQLEVSVDHWRTLPAGTAITVEAVTDVGAHTWRFVVPAPQDPMVVIRYWSECHPPLEDPLAQLHDCWACQMVVIPGATVTNPATVQTHVNVITVRH